MLSVLSRPFPVFRISCCSACLTSNKEPLLSGMRRCLTCAIPAPATTNNH